MKNILPNGVLRFGCVFLMIFDLKRLVGRPGAPRGLAPFCFVAFLTIFGRPGGGPGTLGGGLGVALGALGAPCGGPGVFFGGSEAIAEAVG